MIYKINFYFSYFHLKEINDQKSTDEENKENTEQKAETDEDKENNESKAIA
jgi:hypothetical protein